ncbi:MAG: hypothetical protein JWN76_2884 [Chitinophagaceae bacterium]|nr:hypothetical protein [Chitinophagaceae bacterium]
MKTSKTIRLISIAVVIAITFHFQSCTGGNNAQGSKFYYYPKSNIYYDVDNKHYLAFNDSSNSWQSLDTLTRQQLVSLGKRILINHPADPVYKNNDNDRMIYSVALYVPPAVIHEKFIEDSLNSIPKPIYIPGEFDTENPNGQPKKKGFLKKLFENIFH